MSNTFEHDATPTWSGFIYQGEIALYLAVKKTCELRDENGLDMEEIGTNYMIEVENCEDIAIVHKLDDTKEYLSIHQVKNQRDTTIGKYRSPLVQLMLEKGFYTEKNLGRPNAFLHVSNNVCCDDQNKISRELDQWANKIIEYYKKFIELTLRLESENNDELVLTEIGELVKKEPIKLKRKNYKELKKVITSFGTKYAKSSNEIKDAILQLKNYMDIELCVKSINKDVKVFQYENGDTFCSETEIYTKIKEQVKIYKKNDKGISDSDYEYISDKLLNYMRTHVTQRHQKSQAKEKYEHSFPLSDIVNILDDDLNHYKQEASILALRRKYDEQLMKYCNLICEEECKDVSCKMKEIQYRRVDLNDEEFKKLCYSFNPDCDKSISNLECIGELMKEDGLDDSVFNVIQNVPKHYFFNIEDRTKFIINNNEKNALLTAISGKHSKKIIKNIVSSIENNSSLVSPIFDTDQLITSDLKENELVWTNDYSTIQEKYIKTLNGEDTNQNSICIPKKPEFIKADDIIKDLTKTNNQEAV